MKISETRTEEALQLDIEGRVDTNTAPLLQQAILNAYQKSNHVVLNFTDVPYISSAGLRALLIGQKTANSKKGTMELVHVAPAVLSILEQTGFIEILTVV